MLLWMVRTIYLPGGLCVCPNVDTPERLAALVDIAFNLAVSNQAGGTLRRRIATPGRGRSACRNQDGGYLCYFLLF